MLYMSGQNILPRVFMNHYDIKMRAKAKFASNFHTPHGHCILHGKLVQSL